METLDLAIIYLAFGAPVSVYRYFQLRRKHRITKLLTAFAIWLVWPKDALILLTRAFLRKRFIANIDRSFEIDARVEARGRQLTRSMAQGDSTFATFTVRTVIERYIGLTMAASQENEAAVGAELFAIAGRSDVETSIICLARRNASRLGRHQTDARNDFLRLVEAHIFRKEILGLCREIVELLEDAEAGERLAELENSLVPGRVVSGKELWNAGEQRMATSRLPIDLSTPTTMVMPPND